MTPAAAAIARHAAEVSSLTSQFGRKVRIDLARVAYRRDVLDLKPPGLLSPNRSCGLVQAADGWIAVNLPRPDDLDLLPAWIGVEAEADPWPAIRRATAGAPWRKLVDDAVLLGLPAAGVGEVSADADEPVLRRMAPGRRRRAARPPRVLDLSSMWAGPLCGEILAEMGADVIKLESVTRPDAVREATPALYARLNGLKQHSRFDIRSPDDLERLQANIARADVVITSARPRAYAQLGLTPEAMFRANPGLVWVAVTGYGWTGEAANRVAFGDDAAAAGGLVKWTPSGEPRFAGDALADPITGLAAAVGALKALGEGGGILVDAALARCAAAAARP